MQGVSGVISIWAETDPRAAADWVVGLGDNRDTRFALGQVFNQWSQTDPASASAWLQRQPPSPARDGALIQQATSSLVRTGRLPDAGFLDEISDTQARQQAMTNVAMSAASMNPELARDWIRRLPLSAAEREQMETFIFNALEGRRAGPAGPFIVSPGFR